MNLVEKIIHIMQYEITSPKSYGLFHIGCILISMAVLIYLVKRKEKDHEKSLKRILCIYGYIALILELLKQVVWSFNYDEMLWDYNWYAFPFQLCTTPIFVSLICMHLRKGKLRDSLLSYMAYITILGSLATAIYPETCFVKTLLVDIHTMYLHLGSLVISLYLLIKKEVDIKFKDLIDAYKVFIVFSLIAEFMNICMYKSGVLGDETFNMFYISPYFESPLPIYGTLQEKAPFVLFLLIYLGSILVGGTIVLLITRIFRRLKND